MGGDRTIRALGINRGGAVALVLLFFLSGLAPAAARRSAPPPPAGVTQFYASLGLPARLAIQTDLIWTGDYDGVADGDMSAGALAAVRAFQQRNGGKPTGVLNPQEQTALAAAARSAQQAVGWRLLEDPMTGVRLGVPTKLLARTTPGSSAAVFASPHGELQLEAYRVDAAGTSLAALFDQHRKDPARTIERAVLRPDSFLISGQQGGVKKFYERAEIKNGEVRGAIIRYDISTAGTMARLVNAMASAFAGFASGATGGPQAPKRVEYATGIIVDAAGRILTDRQAAEGCLVITVAGLGNAVREADDTDLALLRLYGVRALRPVPVAASDASVQDVTLVGVADPELQNGAGAVTVAPARLGAAAGAKRSLEPLPAAGFSGAAALDAAGRLVGVVTLVPGSPAQAQLVGNAGLRRFLEAQHVLLEPAAPRPAADVTAGIVRVICTRS